MGNYDKRGKRGSLVEDNVSKRSNMADTVGEVPRGSYRGILVMRDKLILLSVEREFRKLFFVTRDLKVLRDQRRTRIINRHS